MPATKNTIKVEQLVMAPVSQVYRAFTNSIRLERMDGRFCHPGCKTRGAACISGGMVAITPAVSSSAWNQIRSLSSPGLGEENLRSTQVTVTFKPKRKSTLVRLIQRGFGSGKAWENTAEIFVDRMAVQFTEPGLRAGQWS